MANIKRLIVMVLFEHVYLLDVTGPAEVFSLLQREMDEPTGYEVVLAAATLAPVMTSAGVRVLPDTTFADLAPRRIDTLVVPGAVEVDAQRRVRAVVAPSVVVSVRALAGHTRRLASVCVGAHVLAAAGLLEGRRVTTHWSTAQQLADEHPEVKVDADPIFIRDRDVWTGAGLTACLDLALALVADDFGERLALRVARQLVMFLKRPSGQSQFSASLEPASKTRRMDALRHYIMRCIGKPMSIAELAEQAHVSDRQLTRIFKTELNMTPAAYIESVRVEMARNRLETTDEPLERIATTCARDWRSFGAFTAFIVALFVEMYGFPLTIYFLSVWLTQKLPSVDLLSHNAGHLLEQLFGWGGDPHLGPLELTHFRGRVLV